MNFRALYETKMLITVLTRSRHLSPSWVGSVQYVLSLPSSLRSIIVPFQLLSRPILTKSWGTKIRRLAFHLLPRSSKRFSLGFPTKTAYACLFNLTSTTSTGHAALSVHSFTSSEAAMLRGRQNFVRWRLMFVGPHYGSCFGHPSDV